MKQQILISKAASEPKEIFSKAKSINSFYFNKTNIKINNRREIICIATSLKGVRCIHFTSGVLTGGNNNLWFPIGDRDIFKSIESIMVLNAQCNNVVSISKVSVTNETTIDYRVIYNVS